MTWHRLILILALLCVPSPVTAQARLLVLAPPEQSARPTLLEALRLHLRGTVAVELSRHDFPPGNAASRIALATSIVGAERADFAIWLEAVPLSDGTQLFALYVVGGRAGRAVIEVVRLPASSDDPDVDRTLSLKASEIIEAALAQPALLVPATATPLGTRRPARPAPLAPEPAQRRWGLELSGALRGVTEPDDFEVGLGLGTSWLFSTRPLDIDARLGAVLLSDSVVQGARRRVRVSETDLAVGLGLRTPGVIQLGARLDFSLRLLSAAGFAGEERTGSALVAVPGIAAGPELRLRLGPSVSFAAHVSAEWMAVRQSFVVDGAAVADLGRLRGNAQLSLIFFAP